MAVKVNQEKCLQCGGCVPVCPAKALLLKNGIIVDEKRCTGCGICVDMCPAGALCLSYEDERGCHD